jgi:hypothetical protein
MYKQEYIQCNNSYHAWLAAGLLLTTPSIKHKPTSAPEAAVGQQQQWHWHTQNKAAVAAAAVNQ